MELRDVINLFDDGAVLTLFCNKDIYGRRQFMVNAGFIGSLTGHELLSCDVTSIRQDSCYGGFLLTLKAGDSNEA